MHTWFHVQLDQKILDGLYQTAHKLVRYLKQTTGAYCLDIYIVKPGEFCKKSKYPEIFFIEDDEDYSDDDSYIFESENWSDSSEYWGDSEDERDFKKEP